MLETAGFSKSNPYYIVEQGKVCLACAPYFATRAWLCAPTHESPQTSPAPKCVLMAAAAEGVHVALAQVTSITEMKDNQRLALIKDVAGTNVYEEKKGESEKILNDSMRKMDEIKNVRPGPHLGSSLLVADLPCQARTDSITLLYIFLLRNGRTSE